MRQVTEILMTVRNHLVEFKKAREEGDIKQMFKVSKTMDELIHESQNIIEQERMCEGCSQKRGFCDGAC